MEWYKRPTALIAAFILLSLITGLGTYGIYASLHKPASPTSEGAQSKDSATGNTIEDDSSRTPETYGTNPSMPILIGFDAMITEGVTQADLSTFQAAVSQYFISTTTYKPRSSVSLTNPKCSTPDDNGFVNCTYTLTVNGTTTLDGTMRTDLSGPVAITISKDGIRVFATSVA